MRFTKPSRLLLLQVTAFISCATALCRPACASDDALLATLRSADAGVFFWRPFSVSLFRRVATVTGTSHVSEETTEIDDTVTVTVSEATITVAPVPRRAAKRSLAYLEWLPTTYPARRVSSACACLSIPISVTTATATAVPATLTTSLTVTETAASTLHSTISIATTSTASTDSSTSSVEIATSTTETSTAIATETPTPLISYAKIEILRKDTLLSVGWLYNSNGLAIGTLAQAITVNFTLAAGATSESQVRINLEGVTSPALGFVKTSNPSNVVELENSYGSVATVQPTPPGSRPVSSGNDRYLSDIWTVDTVTGMIGWQWVATNGALPTIYIYRVRGRLYPVGNVNMFNAATGGVSSSEYEVIFRYSLVPEI